jgi:hypothetical protein
MYSLYVSPVLERGRKAQHALNFSIKGAGLPMAAQCAHALAARG